MKLLFDQNLSYKLVNELADLFPGSKHVRLLGLEEASDEEIWDYAEREEFTIITQDSDFNERGLLFGHPPKIIWLRCGNRRSKEIKMLLTKNLKTIMSFCQDEELGCLEIY
ncbi:DUF5615 family PIN-like protein [Candidatus Peregrinibacteria bacterium]|nr:MAG: DUF5615 family PIN-like protein [Candidatus Peregrinibacteria bacterium]